MLIKDLITNNKREVKDVLYLIALQGLNYIAPLLVLPYLMVVLGAEKFGYIGFSVAVAQYLMLIVDFGFNLSATKRVALFRDNKQELNKIFSATVEAKMFLLFISFLILLAISMIPQFAVYRSTMLVMFLMVAGNAFLFIFLFQGLGEIRWISIVNAIAKLSILPLTFVLVKSPDDYLKAAFLQGFVSVAAALLSLILVRIKHYVSFVRVKRVYVVQALKESFPIFISTAATSVYTACFVLILGFFATPDEIGKYSAVDRIVRALCFLVLAPIIQAFYPYISRMTITSKQNAKIMLKRMFAIVGFSMLCISSALFFLSPYLIRFLGEDYADTGELFHIMSVIPIFIGMGGVAGQLGLIAIGDKTDKKHFQNVYVIAGVFAILSVLVLSYYYGMYGAAVSLLCTEMLVCLGMIYNCKRIYK